jgi:hypothetical protein
MKFGQQLLALLGKTYEPSAMIAMPFQRYDLDFKTDEGSRPLLLFIGKKDAQGKIKGTRYARRLVTAADGSIMKDHWDSKGKIS